MGSLIVKAEQRGTLGGLGEGQTAPLPKGSLGLVGMWGGELASYGDWHNGSEKAGMGRVVGLRGGLGWGLVPREGVKVGLGGALARSPGSGVFR